MAPEVLPYVHTEQFARATIGQAQQVGVLLARLRAADWPAAKTQAAMIHGIAALALADSDLAPVQSGELRKAKVAADEFLAITANLDTAQRDQLIDRLQTKLQDPNTEGEFLPALVTLLTEEDPGPFEKVYLDSWGRSQRVRASKSARASALGMLSVGLRGYFWATFNLAYQSTNPTRDLDTASTVMESALAREAQLLEHSELAVHAAAANMDPAGLLTARDVHGAVATRTGISLATALGQATRVVDDLYSAGRDNARLRRLQMTTADGLRVARRAFGGAVAVQLLYTPSDADAPTPATELMKQARYAAPYVRNEGLRVTNSLPDDSAAPEEKIRVAGRVQRLQASRSEGGRKLITTVTLAIGRNDPPLKVQADFHDLGHEGLTVGAYLSATGKAIDASGTRVLRAGRVSMSNAARDGWVMALYALAKPWVELSPGGLDLRWSPGKGTKLSADSESSGIGVGDVIYNKPVPPKGYSHV